MIKLQKYTFAIHCRDPGLTIMDVPNLAKHYFKVSEPIDPNCNQCSPHFPILESPTVVRTSLYLSPTPFHFLSARRACP